MEGTRANRHGFPFSGCDSPGYGPRAYSVPASLKASTSAFHVPVGGSEGYFRSRRIKDPSVIQKPWLEKKDSRQKWHTIFPVMGVICGLGLVVLASYTGYASVVNHEYCLVYEDDFSSGVLDDKIWTKEVQLGGFG